MRKHPHDSQCGVCNRKRLPPEVTPEDKALFFAELYGKDVVSFSAESSALDKDIKRFLLGLCAEFAVALNKLFKYPLYVFYEVETDEDGEKNYIFAHAMVKAPDGMYVDAAGKRPLSEIRKAVVIQHGNKIVLKKATKGDLDATSMEGLDPSAITQAEKFIKDNPNRYVMPTVRFKKKELLAETEAQLLKQFKWGHCAEFAVALSKVYRYKIYGLFEEAKGRWGGTYNKFIHGVGMCHSGGGNFVDAGGVRHLREVRGYIKYNRRNKLKLLHMTESDFKKMWQKGLDKRMIAKAVQYIKSKGNFYQC